MTMSLAAVHGSGNGTTRKFSPCTAVTAISGKRNQSYGLRTAFGMVETVNETLTVPHAKNRLQEICTVASFRAHAGCLYHSRPLLHVLADESAEALA